MTTAQKFFYNIIHLGAVSFESVDKTIGDLNKNVGLSADLFTKGTEVIGSTVSENYDLGNILGDYSSEIVSDDTDALKQSLQNAYTGIASTQSVPTLNLSTHISTTVLNYTANMSSTFLSGQMYSFSATGIGSTSIVSIDISLLNISGNIFNSHLYDVPIDFGVYGVNAYNGSNYTSSNLIKFDYAWSYSTAANNLIIKLNYSTRSLTNYYVAFYWGSTDLNHISTNISNSNLYVGTQNFITNVGILTTSVTSISITNVSGRKNFWSNSVPYNIKFTRRSFIETDPYLWAEDRINASLVDGRSAYIVPPVRYPVTNVSLLRNELNSSNKFNSIYSYVYTSGLKYNTDISANVLIESLNSSNKYYNLNSNNIYETKQNYIPLSLAIFQKNPKKQNLGFSSGYSLIEYNQIVPSAFVKVIDSESIWEHFSLNMVKAKNYYKSLQKFISESSGNGISDNFIANFLFGTTIIDVSDYFKNDSLVISQKTLKEFTQPYGQNDIDPINFSKYEEKSIYKLTNIVASKEFVTFSGGKLSISSLPKLPSDQSFELFKPISYTCNGIDPYNQGTGLALDYTINLTFEYENQNTLYKKLYLMASKYLLSENDYYERDELNQSNYGYFYLYSPLVEDDSVYSVSNIEEFRLYGYSGLVPDLKDGIVRPILTKVFSPTDGNKYTYDQYVQLLASQGIVNPDDVQAAIQRFLDEGNTFSEPNLNTHSNQFVALNEISVCATNYALDIPKYWNDNIYNADLAEISKTDNIGGFTQLRAQIVDGFLVDNINNPDADFVIPGVPVGFNCKVDRITINNPGSKQIPGEYTSWILPPTDQISTEQPAQIRFNINEGGTLDATSIEILNRGNFYFDFNTFLTDVGFSTGIGSTNASINVKMDNVARFTATVSFNEIVSFIQTDPPAYGYLSGFEFNNKAFVGLGFTCDADVNILISNYPTADSFFVAPSNLNTGDLESYNSFANPQPELIALNYISGDQNFTLFDKEIFNTLNVPSIYSDQKLSYISIKCKLIELENKEPSGFIVINLYGFDNEVKTKLAESEKIYTSDLNREIYQSINIPLEYTFTSFLNARSNAQPYWVSIKNNLQNCFLNIKGSFLGINTSFFGISSNHLNNDPYNMVVAGQLGLSDYDLDLGITTIGISSIFGSNLLGASTNLLSLYLRKNESIEDTANQMYLRISTTYNSITSFILSNTVSVASLATVYTGIAFTFNSKLLSGTRIESSELVFSTNISKDNVYISRKFNGYDVSNVGYATTSRLGLGATDVFFNFVFNKVFGQVTSDIYASFNNINKSQFGLPNPNKLREINPINIVDGHWSFGSKKINTPVSVYPRAFLSNNSSVGVGNSWLYVYMGYTHDIYLTLGYNSNTIYNEELIILHAYPKWKTTWMDRNELNYKNFSNFNILQQTYIDSIYYRVGLASTVIGISTGPKVAIFEGTFTPQGNLSSQVPVTVGIGTSSGVQVYLNNNTVPIIDTFNVLSSTVTTATGYINTELRTGSVQFKILYFTMATASVEVYWNIIGINSLINASNALTVGAGVTSVNNGYPIDELVFMNVSKTYDEATDINNGYPIGDSFVIRSS